MKLQTLLVAALSAAFFFSMPVEAANSKSDTKATAKAQKPKKSKGKSSSPTSVTFYEGSAENTTERERRLRRECKGRPNAGACSGFTN